MSIRQFTRDQSRKLKSLLNKSPAASVPTTDGYGSGRQDMHVRITGDQTGGLYPCVPCYREPPTGDWIEYEEQRAHSANAGDTLEVGRRYRAICYGAVGDHLVFEVEGLNLNPATEDSDSDSDGDSGSSGSSTSTSGGGTKPNPYANPIVTTQILGSEGCGLVYRQSTYTPVFSRAGLMLGFELSDAGDYWQSLEGCCDCEEDGGSSSSGGSSDGGDDDFETVVVPCCPVPLPRFIDVLITGGIWDGLTVTLEYGTPYPSSWWGEVALPGVNEGWCGVSMSISCSYDEYYGGPILVYGLGNSYCSEFPPIYWDGPGSLVTPFECSPFGLTTGCSFQSGSVTLTLSPG